jgi:integrase
VKPEKHVNVWIQDRSGRSLTLEWNDPKTGKRRQKSTGSDDFEAAEQQRAALEYELNQGTYKESSRLSWKDFRDKVRREYSVHIRPRAAEKIETVLDAFDRFCHPSKIADVDDALVSTFAAKLRTENSTKGKPFATWSIKNYLVAIRTVLRWAESLKLVDCPKLPTRLPKPVPAEAYDRLLDAMPTPEWKGLLMCGWWAGLRINESLRLCRRPSGEDPYVDWDGGRIVLPAASNKSDDDQCVPLARSLREALAAIPGDGDRLFDIRSRQGGKPITRAGASKNICQWAKKAGVRLSMHKLRKGFGSRLAERALPQVLQRLMRHSDVKTTMLFYANVDEAAANAIDSLEDPAEAKPRGARRGAGQERRKAV